jgi:hypothetical protein
MVNSGTDQERQFLIAALGLSASAASKMSLTDLRNAYYTNPPAGSGSTDATLLTGGPAPLSTLPSGASFFIKFDGTNWRMGTAANGTILGARPTARTDVIMQCINPINTTLPSFALTVDQLILAV